MKRSCLRASLLAVLAALVFPGCGSPDRTKPARAPAAAPARAEQKPPAAAKPAAEAERKSTFPLFVIERNKNANVVHYEANLDPDGRLNRGEPVKAYWRLHAEDGRRKKLNWLEKKKAYGIRVKPAAEPDGYTLTLAAAPWLPIEVKQAGRTVRAEAAIGGQPAVLEKMFIQARDKLLGPKVEYIELYGKDPRTGEARYEKILPR